MKELRKQLHALAEHSGREEKTRAFIAGCLKEMGLTAVPCGEGLLVEIPGADRTLPKIAFRADYDAVALPDGTAAHLCGHDGHTAALLGLARELCGNPPARDVVLLFQPAEETGAGAEPMALALKDAGIAEIYGCHNLPGLPLGQVFARYGTMSCGSSGLILRFTGRPAHAAYPETGLSPAGAVASVLQAAAGHAFGCGQNASENTFCTVIGCRMGQKAFGTAAESAEVWLTLRSETNGEYAVLRQELLETARTAAEKSGLGFAFEETDIFPATENHSACAERVFTALSAEALEKPLRWSEDFGQFLLRLPGAYFGLGAGDVPELHTAGYEYPDELLEKQRDAFLRLI